MNQQYDSIIFDMDGVLVTNDSYRKAIQQTVEAFLWQTKSIRKTVSLEYIEALKAITGFNNDWDTSYALIQLLGNDVPVENFRQEVSLITTDIRQSASYQDMQAFFQQVYRGENFNGLIAMETLLISLDIFAKLQSRYTLGIATSRPREEALFAAKNLSVSPTYIPFEYIVAKEDATREKPYPDPILEAKRRMNVSNPIYIGDTINDTIGANAAGMPCIFVGTQQLGDFRIENPNQIVEVLL